MKRTGPASASMKSGKSGIRIARSRGGDIGVFLFLLITGALMFLPFLYAVVQSVKPVDEIFIYQKKRQL